MRVFALLLVSAAMLAGCQTDQAGISASASTDDVGPAPSNYRKIAAAHVRESFVDPWSIRDAEIAPPKRASGPSLNEDGFKTPWVVCLRANAKNRMGGYTGRSVTALAISADRVVNSWDEAHYSRTVCDGVAYQPFPEIEERKR